MDTPIRQIEVSAYTVPTESVESDGTLVWDSTTLVLVEAHAGGKVGLGYTYATPAAAHLIRDLLAETVSRIDAMAISGAWHAMAQAVRNVGRPGLASMAIAAVDIALWVDASLIVPADGKSNCKGFGPVVKDHRGEAHSRYGARLPCLYLIRPDGYIGWRGRSGDSQFLLAYLSRLYIESEETEVSSRDTRLSTGSA
jgi:hypothetical protein